MMNKLFRKKLTRGGFTLAELLIVVAIIAILVAIAIPIFVNGLDDAQYRVVQSDARNVRAVAVSEILTHWNENSGDGSTKYSAGNATNEAGWYAYAVVDKTGNITDLTIQVSNNVPAEKSEVAIAKERPANNFSSKTNIGTPAADVTNREEVLKLGGLNNTTALYYRYKIAIKSVDTLHA